MAPTTIHEKEKERPTSRISGPITRIDSPVVGGGEDGAGGSGEGGEFGKTWSSLVDPGVLESMSGRERKRQEVGLTICLHWLLQYGFRAL